MTKPIKNKSIVFPKRGWETSTLEVALSEQEMKVLGVLVQSGFFGWTLADAAERLISQSLRELHKDKFLTRIDANER